MTPHPEFRAWMRAHNNKFRSYASDEIATLALACGFPIEVVCSHVSAHLVHLKRLMDFWESPLSAKWMQVREHETGHDRWED